MTSHLSAFRQGINHADYHKPPFSPNVTFPFYCPELDKHMSILALFRGSPLSHIVDSLMGDGMCAEPRGGQIAITFPNTNAAGVGSSATSDGTPHVPGAAPAATMLTESATTSTTSLPAEMDSAPYASSPDASSICAADIAALSARWKQPSWYGRSWHIDHIHRKTAGYETDEIKNFSLLIGVYLSEAQHEWSGNIAMLPGSHRVIERYLREEDPLVEKLQECMPQLSEQLQPPQQQLVKPGDVLLAHYQCAHLVAPNLSPSVRYAVYFRLAPRSRERFAFSPKCMTHIWTEYVGIHTVAQEEELKLADKGTAVC